MFNNNADEEPFYLNDGKEALFVKDHRGGAKVIRLETMDEKEQKENEHYFNKQKWKFPKDFEVNVGRISKEMDIDWNKPMAVFKSISKNIERILRKYTYFLNDCDYAICSLYVIFTYFFKYFDYCPRLIIYGSTNSGKSSLLKILQQLCHRGRRSSRASFSAIFRTIERYHPTYIIDEAQDYIGKARGDFISIIKNGYDVDTPIERTNNNSCEPESFDVFGPFIIGTKEKTDFPEDVVNRSFLITMVQKPDCYSVEKIIDKDELADMRTILYYLQYYAGCTTLGNKKLDLQHFIKRSIEQLEHNDRDFWTEFNLPEPSCHIAIEDRAFNIAGCFYGLSLMCENKETLFEKLSYADKTNKNKLRESMCGTIMSVWAEITLNYGAKDIKEFLTKTHKISTKEICDKINAMNISSGDFIKHRDELSTRALRKPIESMGFTLKYGGTDNKTYVEKCNNYHILFEANLKKFASKKVIGMYQSIPRGIFNSDEMEHPASNKFDDEIKKLNDTRDTVGGVN